MLLASPESVKNVTKTRLGWGRWSEVFVWLSWLVAESIESECDTRRCYPSKIFSSLARRCFPDSVCSSSTEAGSAKSSRNTVTSMSSEKRWMSP